jgi:hypothetical protein
VGAVVASVRPLLAEREPSGDDEAATLGGAAWPNARWARGEGGGGLEAPLRRSTPLWVEVACALVAMKRLKGRGKSVPQKNQVFDQRECSARNAIRIVHEFFDSKKARSVSCTNTREKLNQKKRVQDMNGCV